MTILYITRKFPPSIGGMQTQSFNLYKALAAKSDVILISWGYSQLLFPLFFIYAVIKSIVVLSTRKVDVIQLGDLVLSPMGLFLKILSGKPVLTISHGRDSVYKNIIYDYFVLGSAKKLDSIICVSNYMKERLLSRGIPENMMTVIPNGISQECFKEEHMKREDAARVIKSLYDIDLTDKKVILSATRLVPKKGIKEFIKNVFPIISRKYNNAIFLIAGDGPERPCIQKAINKNRLQDKVYLLGFVGHDSDAYRSLFAVSNVFVMPNVRVEKDAEGFGIVILEAIARGLPVVAYDVDGIREAVHNGKNGMLINEKDVGMFADGVELLIKDGDRMSDFINKAQEYTKDKFDWDNISGYYLNEFKKLLK